MTRRDRLDLPALGDSSVLVEFTVAGGPADRVHLFGREEILAVNAALAAGRPLLVRGEPGTGKSQLARAAAKTLGRALITHVIDSHTESRDLLWSFDAVKRLADAQIAGSLGGDRAALEESLAVANYLLPGPLWWAFDWEDAETQAKRAQAPIPAQPDGGDWRNGCVILLDEIDKAESEAPNGLLGALGSRQFTPLGRSRPVHAGATAPLVVITTNEERALPDAFLRRCMVLFLALPEDGKVLADLLIERGRAHFPKASDVVLRRAAEMLIADRKSAIDAHIRPFPGQAEYLDLLRAVINLAEGDKEAQLVMLGDIARYALKKQVGL